jgi:CubicO group peptidase (beta-lactamase class C family)
MMAMSSTKSVTGVLMAMLIAEGKLRLDDRVCKYVSAWCDGVRGEVTVRQLASMTSGLLMITPDSSVGTVSDKNRFALHMLPTRKPGTTWSYSNESAQLLSPILDAAAGEPIQNYATRRLFTPLGMMNTAMHVDELDHAWTYADMETTARDFARIGVLMLHKGAWGGKQIVPPQWIDSLVAPQRLNAHYGLLWWPEPEARAFSSQGHLDTDIHVVPDLDLIVVRMQSKTFPGVQEGEYRRQLLPMLRTFVAGKH